MTRCKAGAEVDESRRRLVVVGVQERQAICEPEEDKGRSVKEQGVGAGLGNGAVSVQSYECHTGCTQAADRHNRCAALLSANAPTP